MQRLMPNSVPALRRSFAEHRFRMRRGVTLIELLIVIAIIMILMSIGGYMAQKMLAKAREKAIRLEITKLEAAMMKLTKDSGKVPPSMGGLPTTTSNAMSRNERFLDYLRYRWPKQKMGGTYTAVRNAVLTKYFYSPRNAFPVPGNSDRAPLDIETMDQAEALVFWLGGFPNVFNGTSTNYVATTKLIGFSSNPSFPFQLDAGIGNAVLRGGLVAGRDASSGRTSPEEYFKFDETKLTDYDQDGWYEYAQDMPGDASDYVPPLVFFDGPLYSAWLTSSQTAPFTSYPSTSNSPPWTGATSAQGGLLAGTWGVAVPYAMNVNSGSTPVQWMNAVTFQIVSAGIDRQYGSPTSTGMRIPLVPAGNRAVNGAVIQGLDTEEEDNLANFANDNMKTYMATSLGQ